AYATYGEPLEITAGEDPADFGAALDEQNTAELVIRHALAQLLGAGIEARGRVIAGESAETIVAQAAALDAQMIIMGRRHLSPFNRLLKGSVSAAVIERAHCPVLVDVRAQ
ncbi:MAG: universal stress protein, partial [Mixta calida]|nr:universal stress protein [Mixta calida]